MTAKSFTKFLGCGPGGLRCACCAPPRGSAARKKLFKKAIRQQASIDKKLAQAESVVPPVFE